MSLFSHTEIEIKELKIVEHYELISKMMHQLHLNEFQLFNKTADWEDIETTYMRHVITMQEENEGLCLVAFKGAEPLGFMFGYLEEQDDSRIEVYTGKELYISDGFVYPDYRRQGIYHKLNQHMENHYITLGVRRLTRFTHVSNTGMRQFLENEGYMITRLMYEKWLDDEIAEE